jgi:DNA-binding NarL/FixJ family response regulator
MLTPEFDIVATAGDGKSALDLVGRHKPDVVVMDLRMPGMNGIEVTREMIQGPLDPPVVICSFETDPDIVDACRKAGALGYVFKSRAREDLILAVKSAAQGKPFISSGQ